MTQPAQPAQPVPPPQQAPLAAPQAPQKTWMPPTGGALAMVSGIVHIIWGIVVAIGGQAIGRWAGIFGLGLIGLPMIILGVVGVIGGIYALQRKVWGMALAGAICSIIGPAALLGILATVFIAISKQEFS